MLKIFKDQDFHKLTGRLEKGENRQRQIQYISKCENVEAFDEAILACIALWLGGNYESQEEFLNYMMADNSNLFLLKIKDMIAKKFEVVKILVAEKSAQLLRQYMMEEEGDNYNSRIHQTTMTGVGDYIITTEDADDIGDIEEDNEINSETETVESAVININRIFRFLQLLWENHFLGNQDYLREQKVDDVIQYHAKKRPPAKNLTLPAKKNDPLQKIWPLQRI